LLAVILALEAGCRGTAARLRVVSNADETHPTWSYRSRLDHLARSCKARLKD